MSILSMEEFKRVGCPKCGGKKFGFMCELRVATLMCDTCGNMIGIEDIDNYMHPSEEGCIGESKRGRASGLYRGGELDST